MGAVPMKNHYRRRQRLKKYGCSATSAEVDEATSGLLEFDGRRLPSTE